MGPSELYTLRRLGGRQARGEFIVRPSRFTDAEIIAALREVKGGTPAVNVCRRLGITQTTFYRWRHKFDGFAASESKQLRELRAENLALKQLVAELLLSRKGTPR